MIVNEECLVVGVFLNATCGLEKFEIYEKNLHNGYIIQCTVVVDGSVCQKDSADNRSQYDALNGNHECVIKFYQPIL